MKAYYALYHFMSQYLNRMQKDRLLTLFYSWRFPRDILFCKLKGINWYPDWRFWGLPLIQMRRRGTISIGRHFVACSNPKHNSLGVIQRVVLKTLTPDAEIRIGENVGISGATISAAKGIYIGNNVLIGSGAILTDQDAHPVNPDKRRDKDKRAIPKVVIIEDDVFIGARAIILKGVTIGNGSVIGAGSIVVTNVTSYAIMGGNPAHKIGDSRDK